MNDEDDMSETEREYHESYKPSWGPEATLLYAMPSKIKLSRRKFTPTNAVINDLKGTFVSEDRDIRFAKFAATPEVSVGKRPLTWMKSKRADSTLSLFPKL